MKKSKMGQDSFYRFSVDEVKNLNQALNVVLGLEPDALLSAVYSDGNYTIIAEQKVCTRV